MHKPDAKPNTKPNTKAQPVPILVVDDRVHDLSVIQAVLDAPDHQLVLMQSANEALAALMAAEFAAILLDVKMPDMRGYQLAKLIHGRKTSQALPIIFMSAHRTDATDAMLGYEAGGMDYLLKPVDPATLRAKVAVFAKLFRQRAKLQAEAVANQVENIRLQALLAHSNPKKGN